MSEVTNNVFAVSDEDVQREAARLIAVSAERNGISVDKVPENARQQAVEYARQNLEKAAVDKATAAADEANPFFKELRETKERLKLAQEQLAATRSAKVSHNEKVIVTRAEDVQRKDPTAWSRMSIPQRLASVGADAAVNQETGVPLVAGEAARYFGKHSDHKLASDLHRSDQRRYKVLREAARILGIL